MGDAEVRLAIDETSQDKSAVVCRDSDIVEGEVKRLNKLGRCRSRTSKAESPVDGGADAEGDLPVQGVPSSREERVSSLKTVSRFPSRLLDFVKYSVYLCFIVAINIIKMHRSSQRDLLASNRHMRVTSDNPPRKISLLLYCDIMTFGLASREAWNCDV